MEKSLIGDNIRKFRKEKNLTQKQLGDLLDMSEVMIGQYERGDRNPKIDTLRRIAKALNVELYDLADWSQYSTEDFIEDFTLSIDEQNEMLILSKEEAQKRLDEELLDYVHLLNEINQEKVVKYAYDLTKIPEYLKKKK
ncbi:helix-turn-helix domain-containing protein [Lacrimispora sp.]|uniref:helix-turn-helix domain-containing protein n=1 Tax=Lacrimispora sp. TaxID=2719234 RepID=UPI003996AF6A